jgi:DNA-binding transcriptional LysR family regulator
MEIRWLEDFIALAKTRHFSRAADEQNVTQPTFSRRIKLLEEEMKVTLVDRNTLPLSLTPAGEVFLQSAEMITRQLRDAKVRCLEIREQEQTLIRFVSTQALYISFYRETFEPMCKSADVELDLNMKSSAWVGSDFVNALTGNETDILLCYWHPSMSELDELDHEHFEYQILAREMLIPCSIKNEQGQAQFQLPGDRRTPLPYISYDDTTFLSKAVHYHIQRQHDIPQLQMISSNLHAVSIKALVDEGYGIGWLPERLISDSLVRAGDERWYVPLEIRIYRAKHNVNPNLLNLWQKIAQQFN